ncbi:hypothetical protein K6119_04245 [Paracrocinitomix mangrovi]|uniref:hypothetical protein n=1 Tax=Paracrocinitomix mangrovi TaxID=2862509 RepID=UPI001C8EF479|nr:hypothetical protein [Paracrocinitomix mangrovi]UKN02724.1 hypothetical protein K6119_04245 [Paracrocinitomix mangrovi]
MKKILIFIALVSSFGTTYSQEKSKLKDHLFMYELNSVYHYIQGTCSWSPSNMLYGLQYKRIRASTEAGIFSFFTGYTGALNYTKLNNNNFLNSSLEFHFRSYPLTALIRFGAGLDFSTDFNKSNYLSFYPSIAFDIGLVEVSYSYLINTHSKTTFSDHRIKLSFGPWVKSKKDNR